MSSFLTLNYKDFGKGIIVAIIASVLAWLYQSVSAPGFHLSDFLTIDWSELLKVAVEAGIAYLSKNLVTDSSGKVLGKF